MTGPRTYDPVSGRFLQGDPVAEQISRHESSYAYSSGNPVARADASGYQDAGVLDEGFNYDEVEIEVPAPEASSNTQDISGLEPQPGPDPALDAQDASNGKDTTPDLLPEDRPFDEFKDFIPAAWVLPRLISAAINPAAPEDNLEVAVAGTVIAGAAVVGAALAAEGALVPLLVDANVTLGVGGAVLTKIVEGKHADLEWWPEDDM